MLLWLRIGSIQAILGEAEVDLSLDGAARRDPLKNDLCCRFVLCYDVSKVYFLLISRSTAFLLRMLFETLNLMSAFFAQIERCALIQNWLSDLRRPLLSVLILGIFRCFLRPILIRGFFETIQLILFIFFCVVQSTLFKKLR